MPANHRLLAHAELNADHVSHSLSISMNPKNLIKRIFRTSAPMQPESIAPQSSDLFHFRVRNVQLEVTYRCNKLCKNCNRHCNMTKLPYLKDTDMSMEQIVKFIGQIKQKAIKLDRIQFLGGEPLLHPGLSGFIIAIFHELMVPGNLKKMQIWTNGIIQAREALAECWRDPCVGAAFDDGRIEIVASPPGKEGAFSHVLAAPCDLGLDWGMCAWPRDCGILLNTYGYWPGGACGPIAVLHGRMDYARYVFPEEFSMTWPRLVNDICRFCVAGCSQLADHKSGQVSPSYQKAIASWMRGAMEIPKSF